MPSDVDICNIALGAIGARATLSSLTEASPQANACALLYPTVRDALLRELRWDFAAQQRTLALLAAAAGTPEQTGVLPVPPLPWLYEYAYPAGCLDVRAILALPPGAGGAVPGPTLPRPEIRWTAAGDTDADGNDIRVILTNQPQAVAAVTAQVTDPNVWDADFQVAVVGRLAEALAVPLSGNLDLAAKAIKDGEAAVARAMAANGNEGTTVLDRVPDWIRVRGYVGDWAGGWAGDWGAPAFLVE